MHERLEYFWQDFVSRPERVRAARYSAAVLGGAVVILVAFLLSRGHPRPQKMPKTRPSAPEAAAPNPVVRDAFGFAKDLESRLRGDARFARVYLVPTAADASQRYGKVVVMGEVTSEADLQALKTETVRSGVPVAVEWQVTVGGR